MTIESTLLIDLENKTVFRTGEMMRYYRLRQPIIYLLGGMLLAAQTGCSGSSDSPAPEVLIPLTGSVTVNGTPGSGVALNFVPAKGTPGKGGYAIADSEGTFEALDYSANAGLEPGTYYVTFSRLLMPDGNPIPQGTDAADVGATESMPPKLSSLQPNHPYQVTVEGSEVEVPFALTFK